MLSLETGVLAAALSLAATTYACSDEPQPAAREGAVECCPPSPQPNCCMSFGGAKTSATCSTVCDGMPVPSDPAWRLVPDEYGCPRWSSEGTTADCCGAKPVPDGGARIYSCYGDHGEPSEVLDPRRAAASYAEGRIACTSDAECCVVYDQCMAKGLVVGAAQRDVVRGLLDDAPSDKCVACLGPRVQVGCVDGACVGAPVFSDAGIGSGLEQDHCGRLGTSVVLPAQGAPLGCGP